MLARMDTTWYPLIGLVCLGAFVLAVAAMYWLVSLSAPSTEAR